MESSPTSPPPFVPPVGWQTCAHLYAPIQIEVDEITPQMRANLCKGEWSDTGFYLGTVQDTVDLYRHWDTAGYTITDPLYERLKEHMRIAQVVGREDRSQAFEEKFGD